MAFGIFGLAETFRLTLPANPFTLFIEMVKTAICPWGVVKVAGFDPRVKSGKLDPCPALSWPIIVEVKNPIPAPVNSRASSVHVGTLRV